jgi:hypothetical protein
MNITGKINSHVKLAIQYFADNLISKQLQRHISIRIVLRKKMDFLGLTDVEDYNESGKPRDFIIEINRNQSEDEILLTLAHEMVHCAQFSKGDLNPTMTVWRGQKVYSDEIPHDEQPWEIEAEKLSVILLEEFKKTNKYK